MPRIDEDSLLFHTLRDSNVIIINDGKTAHRPNAFEFFNNGIVMTNRTLRTNELFQVRLDLVIPKWAGSIEIGVTQHSSNDIQFPFKMSNAKSGTWAITGEDVIRDGIVMIPQYVRNLNRLIEGDSVGVMRKDMGILHFFVNGVDQGPAAFNIPEHVFGIIGNTYGRLLSVRPFIDMPPQTVHESPPKGTRSSIEMCFHRVHGRNARLSRNRLTASRATVYSEFNEAVLFSSRPLRECDMFELRIDKMVDCWIGSLEIGVTAIRPDDLEASGVGAVAGTATDLNWDTYILSGAAMMKDGECIRRMMWHADRSLHYYLDGMDMGKAWYVPHLNIYAVVDLYGQCTQVTILQNEERAFNYNGCANSDNSLLSNSRALSSPPTPYWSFSEYSGDNICLLHDYSVARRLTPDPMAALVFSSAHLAIGEIFEVKIVECKYGYAGSFRMGMTDINILNAHVNRSLPPSISCLPHFTAYIDGRYIKYSRAGSTRSQDMYSFVPSFEWLRPGDRIGFKKTKDSRVLVYYNSELLEMAFEKVPDKVYVVIEIFGHVTKIQAVSRGVTNVYGYSISVPNDDCNQKQTKPVTNGTSSPHNYPSDTPAVSEPIDSKTKEDEIINDIPILIEEASTTEEIVEKPTTTDETNVAPTESTSSTLTVVTAEPRRRRPPLPYTFHYIHGKNIKLCSSDTVALRTTGYKDAIAIVGQPLRRGHNFRFRVDKVANEWAGSVTIGAIGTLTYEPLPQCAMHLEPPAWLVSSDLLNNNGTFAITTVASELDAICEQSVLSVHFRFNGDLVIDIDGDILCVIGSVPRMFSHVFPLIDLYGRVSQVSVLLHPHVVMGGASLDLPIIAENLREESLAELEVLEQENLTINGQSAYNIDTRLKIKPKAYSQDNLIDDDLQLMANQAGPSTIPDPIPITNTTYEDESNHNEIKFRTVHPNRLCLHHSLIMSDSNLFTYNNELMKRNIQKSHSTHSFSQLRNDVDSFERNPKESLRHSSSAAPMVEGETDRILVREHFCDTNIRHNDRYPEANDVDNLDNEIMDALTLETGNLPDLTEEHSSSLDESTRRDEIWSESLTIENLNYLNRILCFDQDGVEGQSLESEWEASGEGCEHLHLVLKYWNFLVCPYPELRKAVSWGQVRCYCSNCQPNPQSLFSGWVRIERIDGVGAAQRGFWHVTKTTLGCAQSANGDRGPVRRPRSMADALCTSPCHSDLWFDEEGKPHHTVLAIEMDVEGSDAENDRLLAFLIYLKPHLVQSDNPPSIEE
ncbi:hypothetical protein K1T71_000267 [Dendrolimus kikuchii]|uniref:Uncharacterized protein n=1 Tax=Dendrolimus kikuchii TaxID=765133 RepID=A0ACC1DIN7_9NEOP|nr:hypothetical protein K1T71_000267 [Dendrolimus kikuchii]